MTFLIIYLITTLIFIYINATACYLRKMPYPWKDDILLCFAWPIVVPVWIINLILVSDDPECSECHNKTSVGHKMSCGERYNKGE